MISAIDGMSDAEFNRRREPVGNKAELQRRGARQAKKATRTVLEQAELFSEAWARSA